MIFKKVKPKNLQSPQSNRFQSPTGGNIPDLAQTYTPSGQLGQPSDPRKLSELKAANFLQNSLYNQSPTVNYTTSPFRSKNNSRSNSKRNSITNLPDFDFETSKQHAKRTLVGKSLGGKRKQKQSFNYTSPQANNRYSKSIDNNNALNNSNILNESQLSRKSAKKTEKALEVPTIEMPGEKYSPYKSQKERVKQEVIDKYSGNKYNNDGTQPYFSHRQFKNDEGLHPTEVEKRMYVDDDYSNFNKNRNFLSPNNDEFDDELGDEVENMKKKRQNFQKSPKNDSSSFERTRGRNDTIQEADQSFTSGGGDTRRSQFNKGKNKQFQHYIYGNDDATPSKNDGNQSFSRKRRNSASSLASNQTSQSNLTGNSSVRRKQMYNRYKKKILNDQKRKSMNDTMLTSMPSFQDLYKDLQSLSKLKRPRPQRNMKNIQHQEQVNYEKQWEGRIFQRSPLRPIEASRVHFMQKYEKAKQDATFKDQEFPPNIRMLTLSKKSKPPNNNFVRALKQYQKTELSLYKYIDPNTINSGELQNINYLTTIAALAENPRNITEILENQRINRQGVYYGKICKNGVFRYYTIDDHFALSTQGDENNPFACSSQLPNLQKEQEIWVQVIEKLLVKAYGTYWDLQKANVKELLRDLTGAPVTEIESNYSIGRTNELTQLLNEYISKKYTVVALQRPGNDESTTKLLPHFGMSIISANQSQGVRLRNPWGIIEDARGLDYNHETGYLKMSWEAFQEIFEKILIVHTDYDKLYCNRTVSHINGAYCIQTFEKQNDEEEFFLEMTQRDRRQFSNLPNISYEYGESRLMLFKTLDNYKLFDGHSETNVEDNIQYIGGVHGFTEKTLTLQVDQATAGQYILVAKIDYPTDKHFDFNISYQGTEKVDFERVEYKEHSNFLGQAFMNLVRSQGMRQKETPQKIMEYLYLEPNLRLVFVGFENRNQIQNNQVTEQQRQLIRRKNMSVRQQMLNKIKSQKETNFLKDFTKIQKEELKLVTIPEFGLEYQESGQHHYYDIKDIENVLKPRHQFTLYPTRAQSIIFSVKSSELQMDSRTLKFLGFR